MYDSNKNGVLEKNEWEKMNSFYHSADTNRNSVITLDELTAKLSQYSKDRDSGGSDSKSSSSGGSDRRGYSRGSGRGSSRYSRPSSSSGSASSSSGNSYRRRLPAERLDGNLPEWFAEKDENKDGQVAMSEYSDSWSSETLGEFKKFDQNGDAIITPEECQKTIDEEDDD